MMRSRFCAAAVVMGSLLASAAAGEVREPVQFQLTQTTNPGESVYVLGSLSMLGGGDIRKAIKLEPSGYPTWNVTIALPVNPDYTYQFYVRDDSSSQAASAANGTPIGSVINAGTSTVMLPGKRLYHHTSFTIPILNWRQDDGAFNQTPMVVCGPGRNPGELKWVAESFGEQGKPVEFFILDDDGTGREPGGGNFNTSLDGIFVQALQLFDSVPPATPNPVTRDYNPASPPSINSVNLGGETRRYRVALPRGYAQNPDKRYPVLYMHDGQNVFDVGAFGSWNALPILNALQQTGRMQEIFVVGVDNTGNRTINYTPPQVGGQADDYVAFLVGELEPLIDAQYRTLTGADTTGTMGSSSGGNVAMYMGWDHTQHYTRIGAISGVWE